MERYIDAENFSQMVYENFGRDGEYDYRDLIRILREQPTADVKEVVRGEWANDSNDYPRCNKCDYMPMFDPHIDDIYYSPFCPHCGADMRGCEGK